MRSASRTSVALGVLAVCALLFVACGSSSDAGSAAESSDGIDDTATFVDGGYWSVEAMDVFGFETVADWVSFPQAVAVASVIGDGEGVRGPTDVSGARTVEQLITLEVIEVVWSDGSRDDLPARFTMRGPGFVYRDDVRYRVDDGGPRWAETDGNLLAALYFDEITGNWSWMSVDSAIPLGDDGTVSEGLFAGLTTDQVAERLATAVRHPHFDYSISNPMDRVLAFVESVAANEPPEPELRPGTSLTEVLTQEEFDEHLAAEEETANEALEQGGG